MKCSKHCNLRTKTHYEYIAAIFIYLTNWSNNINKLVKRTNFQWLYSYIKISYWSSLKKKIIKKNMHHFNIISLNISILTTYEQQLPFHQVQSGDVFLLRQMEEWAEQQSMKNKISFNYIKSFCTQQRLVLILRAACKI